MPCNCGKKNAANQKFVYVAPDGKVSQPYPTETQAKAAKIRAGGTGLVRPA